jgi:two-component system phosphate regulon sensor histidine kinase PhoR
LSWTLFLALGGGLLGAFILFRFWQSLREIRLAIARLADRDFRTVIVMQRLGFFRRTARNLRTISEHLQRQNQRLAEDDFSLRAILSSMAEGVLIVNPSHQIKLCNDALRRMFLLQTSPIDRHVAEVFLLPDLQHCLRQTFADGRGQLLELVWENPTAEPASRRYFEVYTSPLTPGPDRVIHGAVVVFHDITSQKVGENMRRDFVANVSHEFRTPLAIINGYLETLREEPELEPEMLEKSLNVMHKHCQRLNLLIEDLLVISRLEHESGRYLQCRSVDLREIVHKVVEQLEPRIRESDAAVTTHLPTSPVLAEVDPWRLEQVFFNLLNNALRYGHHEEQPPRVDLFLEEETEFVTIRCRDHGPGIPPADQPHIFERFYRVHKDRSRHGGGTGLGLSIVKHIVLAHDGEVSLSNPAEAGAEFIVRLPRQHTYSPGSIPDHPLHQLENYPG